MQVHDLFGPIGVGIKISLVVLLMFGLAASIAGCGSNAATQQSPPPPAPSISSISPSSATAGGGGFTLTVNGSNFVQGAVVQWNGASRTTTFVSSAQLTAAIAAGDVASAGAAQVTVVNPASNPGASNVMSFTILAVPIPSISSISPSSATAGAVGFTLTVNGSNFVQGAVVQWNGSDRPTTFVSASQLTTAIPGSDLAAPGTAAVQVRNPASPPLSNAAMFTIQPANPTPVISSLSPSGVLVGWPDFTLTVIGSGFVSGAVLQWNGGGRATTFVTSSQLNAAISAGDVAKSGPQQVTALNPGSLPSSSVSFLVSDPTPTLSTLSPGNTMVGGQGFTLTVNGTNFIQGATLLWNDSSRTTQFVGDTQLTAAISSSDIAQVGTATVLVANPFSPQSNPLTFEIDNPRPTISSLAPPSVMAGAAPFDLTVNGNGFVQGAVVNWNGNARATTFLSGTQLATPIAASDVSAQGAAQVTVVNPGPSLGPSAAAAFTIGPANNPVPSLSSLSDTSAPAGWPGFPLTVNGTGLVAATTGQWNGLNRTTSVLSSTLLKSAILLGDLAAAKIAQVGLFNPSPGGGASNAVSFSIKSVVPGAVGVIERSSVATDLTEANLGSGPPAISADGRFVVFASDADNLVTGDTNNRGDVFLRDTCLGVPAGCVPSVVRVSVASDGAEANQSSSDAAISANARYVAFSSAATNLVPGVTSGNLNVYVRDTCTGASAGCIPSTTLLESSNSANFEPSLSADGRFVSFTTGFFGGGCDYYGCDLNSFMTVLHDTCAGAPAGCNPSKVVVSIANDGGSPNDTNFDPAARISADGRYVAFQSVATNLVPNDTNNSSDVFVRDTCFGASAGCVASTTRVSVANDGSQASRGSFINSISQNGRYVAFTSAAANLVDGDTNGFADVFVRDTCFGAPTGCTPSTKRVSLANDGSQGNGDSSEGMVTADGRFVVFTSGATNLVAGDTSPFPKIFLRDTCIGASTGCTPSTVRLSVALDGTPANNQTFAPMLNGNARYVVFLSLASNLAPGDTNQAFDVFVARTNVP